MSLLIGALVVILIDVDTLRFHRKRLRFYVMRIYYTFMHRTIFAALIGTSLVGAGVLLIILRVWILETTISLLLVLGPNSLIVDYWLKPLNTVYTDFYFFNWTNPDAIRSREKLQFVEVGPYRFNQTSEKVNVTWNFNDTVTFKRLNYWYFDEWKSVGKLTDRISTIDPVVLNAAYQFNEWTSFTKKEFSLSLSTSSSRLYINRTINELLFHGYRNAYVDLAESLPFLDRTLPPLDKIGWFTSRNGSYNYEGTFNMGTSGDHLGQLLRWNYQKESFCGKVHGSANEIYKKADSKQFVEVYAVDLCRKIKLNYDKDVTLKNVGGIGYAARDVFLETGTQLPENQCNCNDKCLPSGVLNISSCNYGMPYFISLPHFHQADKYYLKQIDGLHPEKSKHDYYISLEPNTGVVLSERRRLQLNIYLHPVSNISLIDNVPTVMVPILWFETKTEFPEELMSLLQLLLKIPVICTVLAVIDMIMGIGLLFYARRRYKIRNQPFYGKPRQKKYGNFEEVPLHDDMDSPYMSTTIGHDYLEVIHDDYDD